MQSAIIQFFQEMHDIDIAQTIFTTALYSLLHTTKETTKIIQNTAFHDSPPV